MSKSATSPAVQSAASNVISALDRLDRALAEYAGIPKKIAALEKRLSDREQLFRERSNLMVAAGHALAKARCDVVRWLLVLLAQLPGLKDADGIQIFADQISGARLSQPGDTAAWRAIAQQHVGDSQTPKRGRPVTEPELTDRVMHEWNSNNYRTKKELADRSLELFGQVLSYADVIKAIGRGSKSLSLPSD
jgi:hypothetical protein